MIPPEEQARADCYGLIARLFHAAPDSQLIAQLLQAPEARADEAPGDAPLASAWHAMIEGCREASPAALEEEHTGLFCAMTTVHSADPPRRFQELARELDVALLRGPRDAMLALSRAAYTT